MAMITNPGHAITLGGLSLVAAGKPVTHAEGFTTEVSADGTTWGNPEVVVSTLISELSDGDIVTQTRAGNRQPVLYVRVSSATHAGLVAGDSALSAAVGGPCELTWQPPDALAPLTVIDVVHSRMDHQWDDMDALHRRRTWVIAMSALPWPRSSAKVISPAVATAAPTVVDSGAATTNWAASGGTISVVTGAVTSTYDPRVTFFGGSAGTALTRTAVIDTTTEKYIGVDYKSSIAGGYYAFREVGGANMAEVRREPAPTAGFTRSWFKVDDAKASLASIYLDVLHPVSTLTSATLSIDQVIKAATLPISGTARQLTRTIDPNGNVPAEGTIMVQHATLGLGQTIVYSHPVMGGYSPPLRQWRTASAAVTADANVVSGAYNSIATDTLFEVPIASVPKGDVQLWARLNKATTGGTVRIAWAAASAIGGASVDVAGNQNGATDCNFPAGDTWYLFPLARLTLPTTAIGPAGKVSIAIVREGTAGVVMDEAWIFAMDRGRLTVVDCKGGTPGAPGPSNRLRITAPSVDDPYGSILIGTQSDWSDSYEAPSTQVLCSQMGHRFDPAGSMIFTVTHAVTDASVSFEHYPRWRAEAGS